MDEPQRDNLSTAVRLLCLAGIIVISFIAVAVYHSVKTTNHVNKTVYTSTKDNFKVTFSNTPSVQNAPSRSDGTGGTETTTLYSVDNNSAHTDYAVYIDQYSNLNANTLNKSQKESQLEGDIDQIAQADSSSLSHAKFITFDNQLAASVTVTPQDKNNSATQIIAFLYNDKLYMVLGSGISQAQFKTFSNSFHLL